VRLRRPAGAAPGAGSRGRAGAEAAAGGSAGGPRQSPGARARGRRAGGAAVGAGGWAERVARGCVGKPVQGAWTARSRAARRAEAVARRGASGAGRPAAGAGGSRWWRLSPRQANARPRTMQARGGLARRPAMHGGNGRAAGPGCGARVETGPGVGARRMVARRVTCAGAKGKPGDVRRLGWSADTGSRRGCGRCETRTRTEASSRSKQ
jgi:hypothetical protein